MKFNFSIKPQHWLLPGANSSVEQIHERVKKIMFPSHIKSSYGLP